MSTFVVELPIELRQAVSSEAARRGLTVAAWLAEAAREKLVAEAEAAYLAHRATQADRAAYEAVLNRVPAAPPEPGDER